MLCFDHDFRPWIDNHGMAVCLIILFVAASCWANHRYIGLRIHGPTTAKNTPVRWPSIHVERTRVNLQLGTLFSKRQAILWESEVVANTNACATPRKIYNSQFVSR